MQSASGPSSDNCNAIGYQIRLDAKIFSQIDKYLLLLNKY